MSSPACRSLISGKRCIVLGGNLEIEHLCRILGFAFEEVHLVETESEMDRLSFNVPVSFLVATDSFPGGLDRSLLESAKEKFAPRVVLCFVNHMDRETEISLRSTGLAFLGTIDSFKEQAGKVLTESGKRG